MAILRANTGGAWASASVWQVYDEDTNTWSAYGYAPRNNDIVYLNGKTITLSNNQAINIENGTIRNDANTNIGVVAGGYLSGYANTIGHKFTANFINTSTYIFTVATSDATITITGDVTSTAGVAFNRTGSSGGVYYIVTGNVTLNNGSALGQSSSNYNTGTIIGNVTVNSSQILKGTSNRSLTVTGNITCESGQSNIANSLVIVGNVIGTGVNACITIDNIDINGGIAYKSSNPNYLGIKYTGNLVIQNPDTFTWHDISEPRINPFIIITDWDFANEVQYPPENRVVAGIPYAYDEKVGTFAVDYPQEAVVLKDVVYDSGNKTGKLVVLPAELISRLLNCPTIETMQQLLIAHLNPETD